MGSGVSYAPKRVSWSIALAGTLMLGACAHYEPAPLAPATSAREFAARRLGDESVRDALTRTLPPAARPDAAAWPPPVWDRAQLLAVALSLNPRLAVASAEWGSTRARETTAAERPNPELLLESEYAVHDQHPWLYGLSIDWLLRSAGRRREQIELARLETRAARLALMEEIWNVRSALSAALSDRELARRREGVLEELARAQDRRLASLRRRVQAGEDSPPELTAPETERIETDEQLADAALQSAHAQAALATALGLPTEALDGLEVRWDDWGAPAALQAEDLAERRELALLSRPDLGAAIGAYAVAEQRLRLAIRRQYPDFALEPGYYWDHGIAKWPFDLGFIVPLNGNKGEIAEARAARELAARRMLALQTAIDIEISAARTAEAIGRDSVRAAEQRLAAARHRIEIAAHSVALGAAERGVQVEAEVIAARSELERLDGQARLQAARDALEQALHVPLSGPETTLTLLPLGAPDS
jgi:outer membrane protein TolC